MENITRHEDRRQSRNSEGGMLKLESKNLKVEGRIEAMIMSWRVGAGNHRYQQPKLILQNLGSNSKANFIKAI